MNLYAKNKLQRNLRANKSADYAGGGAGINMEYTSLTSYTPFTNQAESRAILELRSGASVLSATTGSTISARVKEKTTHDQSYGRTPPTNFNEVVTMQMALTATAGKICLELNHSQNALGGSITKQCINYKWTN